MQPRALRRMPAWTWACCWAIAALSRGQELVPINAAGSPFPASIYSAWSAELGIEFGIRLNYQSIGFGGGIKAIEAGNVDFGATNVPLSADLLSSYGLVQFPMVAGAVAPVFNLDGVDSGALWLSGELLADIYLGKVKNWSDPRIAALNPNLALPDLPITPVHKSDGSGTNWLFTRFLDKVSPDWHTRVGANVSVNWPVGVGAKGGEGVPQNVAYIDGSIGYVEFAFAIEHKMRTAFLENRAKAFVAATSETITAALENADWAGSPDFNLVPFDSPGAKSWPIVGASLILMKKEQSDPAKAKAMLRFFDACYRRGGEAALEKEYVPMPDSVVTRVENRWHEEIRSNGEAVWP